MTILDSVSVANLTVFLVQLPRSMPAARKQGARVAMGPYLDALPTRQPRARTARARRFQSFMRNAIDA